MYEFSCILRGLEVIEDTNFMKKHQGFSSGAISITSYFVLLTFLGEIIQGTSLALCDLNTFPTLLHPVNISCNAQLRHIFPFSPAVSRFIYWISYLWNIIKIWKIKISYLWNTLYSLSQQVVMIGLSKSISQWTLNSLCLGTVLFCSRNDQVLLLKQ